MKVGDYALVVARPASWESSGEESVDLDAYVGHVGIILEIDPNGWPDSEGMALLRFPTLIDYSITGQRNIELEVLTFISSPIFELPSVCIDESERKTRDYQRRFSSVSLGSIQDDP